MEKNFTNENFEHFLKQNAEGLRMFPSDKVWKGISGHFRQRKRRLGLFIGIGMLLTTAGGYYLTQDAGQNLAGTTGRILPREFQIQPGHTAISKEQAGVPFHISPETHSLVSNTGISNNDLLNRQTAAMFTKPTDQNQSLTNRETDVLPGNPATNDNPAAFETTIVDDTYPIQQTADKKLVSETKPAVDPLTIESVLNSYNSSSRRKFTMQLHFTPTVSYRKLRENTEYLESVNPSSIPSSQMDLYDVNKFVTHKPDFGFEIGLTGKYAITDHIRLRAGLQFNVNRYDIKVFHSSTQTATIRLNNGIDSVNRQTNYSNTPNVFGQNWLQNFYFQVSAPVGAEFRLRGDKNVEFGIATTVQPTYVLGDRAYLISTDYKNYVEVPWLIRKWNVNTSLETFVAYSTGKLNWQVGPQVRYQLLSSFVRKYPVKENLFDFGLKVGVGINKN